MSSVLLGLGSNLDDPPARLAAALRAISEVATIDRVSSVYRTEPVGVIEQPDFYNLVCRVFTEMSPGHLLARLLEIERAMGRVRTVRFGPRKIDVDLLCYDDLVLDSADLTIPHPRMDERPFVLVPLREIVPDWRHPVLGRTAGELLDELGGSAGVEPVGPIRWRRDTTDTVSAGLSRGRAEPSTLP